MQKFIMLAGAAAMAVVVPSLADAQGRGKGQSARSGQSAHGTQGHGRARHERARTGSDADRGFRDNDWVLVDGRWVRVAEHGRTTHPQGCPPGLANRTPRCMPPGQARRLFREGQVLPRSYRDLLGYQDVLGRVPEAWRDDIPVGDYRYIYRDNSVYVVDPRTRLIQDIIDIVL